MDNSIQLASSKGLIPCETLEPKTSKSAVEALHFSGKGHSRIVTNFVVEKKHLYIIALPDIRSIAQVNSTQLDNQLDGSLSPIELAQRFKPEIEQVFSRENLLHSIESHFAILHCFKSNEEYYVVVQVSPLCGRGVASSRAVVALSTFKQSFGCMELQQLLTPREQEIICLIAVGLPNKQIARRLDISVWTVSAHLRRIFIKLKVDTRAAVVYQCAKLIQSWERHDTQI